MHNFVLKTTAILKVNIFGDLSQSEIKNNYNYTNQMTHTND